MTDPTQGKNADQAATETSLLEQIFQASETAPEERGATTAAFKELLNEMLSQPTPQTKVNKATLESMMADIDAKLSAQVNEILHNSAVQQLESTWRSLKFAVDRIDFRQNTKLNILQASKEELSQDFDDAPETTQSGLYRHVYKDAFGVYGGEPYGLMTSMFDFGPNPQDVALLSKIAAVSAMAHVPFIGNAGPEFFRQKSLTSLGQLKDIKALFERVDYAKWNSFRENPDSRYVGMALPRFMLRLPYTPEKNKGFQFTEEAQGEHDRYLWGPASIAMATRVADSFANWRWAANITGPEGGGAVRDLPLHVYKDKGATRTAGPTEVLMDDHTEYTLAELGFIPLLKKMDSDLAAFFSANSVHKPQSFGISAEGKEAELNYKLGTKHPYMMVISRLAHYIKVLQRNHIGTWKSKEDLNRELNKWIGQYVSAMPDAHPDVKSRRPLQSASVVVSDVEGQPGWYKCEIKVKPHFKYEGADFELSLVGRLDKK